MMEYKKSLGTHTTIAQLLNEHTSADEFLDELDCEQDFLICADVDKTNSFIEDLMANRAPSKTVVRLICMQSIAGGGLKQKVLDSYKRDLVQTYGIEVLLAISNLEKVGLIKVQAGSRTYAVLRKVSYDSPLKVIFCAEIQLQLVLMPQFTTFRFISILRRQ